ncbi:MAG: peptidylprolyl isomerase [Nitrospirota bacterium]
MKMYFFFKVITLLFIFFFTHQILYSSEIFSDEKHREDVRKEPESHAAVSLDRVIAVVNKEVITWSELYKMMEQEATDHVKALHEEERMNIFKDNEAFFLDKLIDLRLQIQEAKRLGLGVTPEEMTEAIENIKKKYSLTDNALRESLEKEGLTFEEYRKRLSEQITVSKLVGQQIRSKIVISDKEVKKYMEENKKRFGDGETLRLRQIFFKRPKNDAEKKALEDRADLIIQKLKAGEDFSALAKEYSEDPSGKFGGDLGFMKKDLLAKEFIDVLDTMKIGDFSIPFWSEKGLHIIKLEEKVSAQSIDEVREDVRKQLAEDQFSERYKNWIKGLREKAYIEIRL